MGSSGMTIAAMMYSSRPTPPARISRAQTSRTSDGSRSNQSAMPPATPKIIRSVRERYRRSRMTGASESQLEAARVVARAQLGVGLALDETRARPRRIAGLGQARGGEVVRAERPGPADPDRGAGRQADL